MNVLGIGFYGWCAGIILFLLMILSLNVYRFGAWVLIIALAISGYMVYLFGWVESVPSLTALVIITMLFLAHILVYTLVENAKGYLPVTGGYKQNN